MVFEAQSSAGRFVAWGKEKAKENSYIIEEKKNITGLLTAVKKSEKYGVILEIKSKEVDEPLLILGTSFLNRELGFSKIVTITPEGKQEITWIENPSMYTVKEQDVIRITFNGMKPVKGGNEAYDLSVEVDK